MEQLYVFGTGNAQATNCYNTCFALRDGDEYFMVDAGGGNGILKILDDMKVDLNHIHHIFVTHEHTDHILGIIWTVSYTHLVDSDAVDSCRIGCVRASGRQTGRLAAELLAKLVPCRGRVILMSGNIRLKLLRDNTYGFCSCIAESRPDLAVLNIGNECGELSLEDTLVQELNNHPDIVGIYCNSASNVPVSYTHLRNSHSHNEHSSFYPL